MSVEREFETVDVVLKSSAETRGVDAFALALIKAERQVRRLFTHLVYQAAAFSAADIPGLRATLAANRRVYFAGFLAGIEALYPRTVKSLIGAEHDHLKARILEAIDHRHKIFHGQLTTQALTREDLIGLATDIRAWCRALASGAMAEVGYDGFARDSFRKSTVATLSQRLRLVLKDTTDYAAFIKAHMER
jgi:hypothetical protein